MQHPVATSVHSFCVIANVVPIVSKVFVVPVNGMSNLGNASYTRLIMSNGCFIHSILASLVMTGAENSSAGSQLLQPANEIQQSISVSRKMRS